MSGLVVRCAKTIPLPPWIFFSWNKWYIVLSVMSPLKLPTNTLFRGARLEFMIETRKNKSDKIKQFGWLNILRNTHVIFHFLLKREWDAIQHWYLTNSCWLAPPCFHSETDEKNHVSHHEKNLSCNYFGTSGFTGQYVALEWCRLIMDMKKSKIKWAIAGRSEKS